MNVCHPYFEKHLINNTYATRIGKGTYKALEKAQYYCYNRKYYLKLDIRKYFDSISHLILKQKLIKLFKDPMLLYIFEQIIDSYNSKKPKPSLKAKALVKYLAKVSEKGLPIGNLTSQYFANYYLSDFDHFIKEKLQIKFYVRYMDDFIIWANTNNKLLKISEIIEEYLKKELSLYLKIKQINTCEHGLNFLSYRLFNTHTELAQKSKKRFIKKLKQYDFNLENDIYSQKEYQRHVLPLIAFTEHASAKGFRKKVFKIQEK